MTTDEFSNEFDILYNNIMSNQAPGLDEYEKSVFLTIAQSDLIRDYFNPKTDRINDGFDGSQKRQYDFSSLIKTVSLVKDTTTETSDYNKIDSRGEVYLFPTDYFLSINEIIQGTTNSISVIPISYDEYQRLMTKPYAYPPKRMAWRLFLGKTIKTNSPSLGIESKETEHIVAEIIGNFPTEFKYNLRYVQKPSPIILVQLEGGLSIDGISIKSPCKLPDQLHQEILERAVTLAKIAYQAGSTPTIEAQRANNNYNNYRQ